MRVDFLDSHGIQRSAELAHGAKIEPAVAFVCSLVNQVEVSTDQQRAGAVCLDVYEFAQEVWLQTDAKFRRTAKALKSWSMRNIGSVRLQRFMARKLIAQLDAAQENRLLKEEGLMGADLKCRSLGFASLARTIARHRSQMVLGFVLKKNSVPTELYEFWENSDEFRTQFGEISECKA
jgi:hypothetical protein